MTIAFETPRERRERHLRAALKAHDIAANAPNDSVRIRYLELAKVWLTMASEVSDPEANRRGT